jgi:ketosteroid isomerase-like protein
MPAEPLELVASLYPGGSLDWAAVMGDPERRRAYEEAVAPLIAEDCEMVPVAAAGSGSTVVGPEAYVAALRDLMEAFESFCITPERFVELGDRVAVMARLEGRTKEGGVEFAGRGGAIVTVRQGRIQRIEEHDSRETLLAAAGITGAEAEERGVPTEAVRAG